MQKNILITGASSGIGESCAVLAASLGLNVIATARSSEKLQQLRQQHKNIQIIIADIATEDGRDEIAQRIKQSVKQPIHYLLHNAALLQEPQKFSDLNVADFRLNIATNVEPILFLTQKLLPHLAKHSRILCVSTGAAKQAIAGMSHYCVSKAAAMMATDMLKAELEKDDILVNNFFPGVVDTKMQKTLRHAKDEVFPYAEQFRRYKKDKQLASADEIAIKILKIFQKFSASDYLLIEP